MSAPDEACLGGRVCLRCSVPPPELADALPPLPPRGENFDDSVSNKLLNHAFSRSAKNLLGGSTRGGLTDGASVHGVFQRRKS